MKPTYSGACAPKQEKPLQWEAHTLQQQIQKACLQQQRPRKTKINNFKIHKMKTNYWSTNWCIFNVPKMWKYRWIKENESIIPECVKRHLSGEGNGHPLQYSCLKIPWTEEHGRLPWGRKDLTRQQQSNNNLHTQQSELWKTNLNLWFTSCRFFSDFQLLLE